MCSICVQQIDGVWFAVAFNADEKIVASSFSCKGRKEVITRILESLPEDSSFSETKPKGEAIGMLKALHRIYEGKLGGREFNLEMDALPPFIKKVLLLTYKIPRGSVATYGRIAEALGNKAAARVVGQAEATNPFSPIIPCHRVIGSDLELHGYFGGLDVKRAILEREGVVFVGNRVSKESLWFP